MAGYQRPVYTIFHSTSVGAGMVRTQPAHAGGLSDKHMNYPLELTVMMYHYIRDRGDEAEAGTGIPGMPVKAFRAQLDGLSKQHTLVTWPDVRMAVQGQNRLPVSACLLTF